ALEEDVRARQELLELSSPGGGREVDAATALVRVAEEERQGPIRAGQTPGEWAAATPGITLWPLDLEHIGSQVRQDPTRDRTADVGGIEDAQMRERAGHDHGLAFTAFTSWPATLGDEPLATNRQNVMRGLQMASDRPPLRGDPDLRSFRVAALLALPALALFLPEAQGHHVIHLPALVGMLVVFELLALGVSFTPLARHPHRLGFVLTIGVILASIASFYLIRGDPAVTAAGLLALLGGTLFFFSWTAGEALVLLATIAAAFGIAVHGFVRTDFLVAPMVAPWFILLGGGSLVVAASRFIGRIRAGLAAREVELATLSE